MAALWLRRARREGLAVLGPLTLLYLAGSPICAQQPGEIRGVVTRTTDETCGTEIVMPAFAVNQKLPLNEPVEVVVTPTEPGTIAFACGMDMLKGSIVVQ